MYICICMLLYILWETLKTDRRLAYTQRCRGTEGADSAILFCAVGKGMTPPPRSRPVHYMSFLFICTSNFKNAEGWGRKDDRLATT